VSTKTVPVTAIATVTVTAIITITITVTDAGTGIEAAHTIGEHVVLVRLAGLSVKYAELYVREDVLLLVSQEGLRELRVARPVANFPTEGSIK
jgi:hypothetical protein